MPVIQRVHKDCLAYQGKTRLAGFAVTNRKFRLFVRACLARQPPVSNRGALGNWKQETVSTKSLEFTGQNAILDDENGCELILLS